MARFTISSLFLVTVTAVSAYATDLATVIAKVSANCDKIATYSAEARVHYRICPDWYDRVGRYQYNKPDSTRLELADTIAGTDTTWTVYSSARLSGCSFSLVPSILIDPIMSAKTIASWADSGKVVSDTLDTCVIEVGKDGLIYNYSVDMARGVVIGFYTRTSTGPVTQQFFYGYDKGVHFLRKMSCSWYDTTIQSGGYEFFNIRVNGEPVTRIAGHAPAQLSRGSVNFSQRAGVLTFAITGKEGARVSLWDLLGRNLFAAQYASGAHTLALDQVCHGRFPAGSFLLRVEQTGKEPYSTLIIR